tara:strand:- start:118 stop:573 length:456 start_codon:yes stop_codon:yes gene_type:complete
MKKALTFVGACLFAISSIFAQEKAATQIESAGGPEMTFEAEVIDYGTITQNADGVRTFKFTNTGTSPLIISNAKGSCGCTVPTWPKQPINPGETGEIKVKYATDRLGPINKSVTVTSNAASATKVLRIKGNVINKETTPVKEASEMMPKAN